MKDLETKDKFVQMRAEGKSFATIAEAIGVSKPTLLKWSFELRSRVDQCRGLAIEALVEKYRLKKQARIEDMLRTLQRIREELDERTFKDVRTEALLTMQEKLGVQIQDEITGMGIPTGDTESLEADTFRKLIKEITVPID